MEQKIEELTENERAWIIAQIQAAAELAANDPHGPTSQLPSLAELDAAFAHWLSSNPTDVQAINPTINAIGIAFGEHLVRGLGMRWVIATDSYGTDLAVHALQKGDILVYPANFVAKRWERRETNFLSTSYDQVDADVDRIAKRNPRPFWKFW